MTAHAMRAHQEPPIPPLPGGDPDGEPGRQPPLPPGTPYPGRPQVDPPVGPPGEPGRPPPEIITGSLSQAERRA